MGLAVSWGMNETFGWACVLAGFLAGMLLGLRFHEEGWLGGYSSFPRRMLRLGHVALVALGLLNVVAARSLEVSHLGDTARHVASLALIVGALTMPATCALVAWMPRARHAFAVPITALLLSVSLLLTGSLS